MNIRTFILTQYKHSVIQIVQVNFHCALTFDYLAGFIWEFHEDGDGKGFPDCKHGNYEFVYAKLDFEYVLLLLKYGEIFNCINIPKLNNFRISDRSISEIGKCGSLWLIKKIVMHTVTSSELYFFCFFCKLSLR